MWSLESDKVRSRGVYGKGETITKVTPLGNQYTTTIPSYVNDRYDYESSSTSSPFGVSAEYEPASEYYYNLKQDAIAMDELPYPDGFDYNILAHKDRVSQREKYSGSGGSRRGRALKSSLVKSLKKPSLRYEDLDEEADIDLNKIILTPEQIAGITQEITHRIIPNTDKVFVKGIQPKQESIFDTQLVPPNPIKKYTLPQTQQQQQQQQQQKKTLYDKLNEKADKLIEDLTGKESGKSVRSLYHTETEHTEPKKIYEQFASGSLKGNLGEFNAPSHIDQLPQEAFVDMYHFLPNEFTKKIKDTIYCIEVQLRFQPWLVNHVERIGPFEKFKMEAEECGLVYVGCTVTAPDFIVANFKFMEPPPPDDDPDAEVEEEDVVAAQLSKRNDIYGNLTEQELISCMEDRLLVHLVLDIDRRKFPITTDLEQAKITLVKSKNLRFRTVFFSLEK